VYALPGFGVDLLNFDLPPRSFLLDGKQEKLAIVPASYGWRIVFEA
jgi:hypothetical protein